MRNFTDFNTSKFYFLKIVDLSQKAEKMNELLCLIKKSPRIFSDFSDVFYDVRNIKKLMFLLELIIYYCTKSSISFAPKLLKKNQTDLQF